MKRFVILLFMLAPMLSACGPSVEDIATQTAAAWTVTPKPTNTRAPTTTYTSTPKPTNTRTPTSTPTPTEKPTITPTFTPTSTTGRIEGRVYRSDTNESISNAIVSLGRPESIHSIVQEAVSDEQGYYVMEDIEPGEYVLFLVLYIENESQSPCELPATYEPIFYELNGRNVMAVIEQRGDIWALETSVEEPRGTWGDKYLLAMVMLDYSVSAGDVRSFDFDLYCGH